eukprot:6238817-Amphidinium_carterae.1
MSLFHVAAANCKFIQSLPFWQTSGLGIQRCEVLVRDGFLYSELRGRKQSVVPIKEEHGALFATCKDPTMATSRLQQGGLQDISRYCELREAVA